MWLPLKYWTTSSGRLYTSSRTNESARIYLDESDGWTACGWEWSITTVCFTPQPTISKLIRRLAAALRIVYEQLGLHGTGAASRASEDRDWPAWRRPAERHSVRRICRSRACRPECRRAFARWRAASPCPSVPVSPWERRAPAAAYAPPQSPPSGLRRRLQQ